jgi:ankyrin repeat protein
VPFEDRGVKRCACYDRTCGQPEGPEPVQRGRHSRRMWTFLRSGAFKFDCPANSHFRLELSEGPFPDMDGSYVLDIVVSYGELAVACILYLQLNFPKDGPCQDPQELYQTIQRHPFSFYAVQNFDYHIAQIPVINIGIVHFFNKLLAGSESPRDDSVTYDRGDRANRAIATILQIRLLRNPFNPLEISDGFDKSHYSVHAATMLYATRLKTVRWLVREARWPIPQAMPTIHSASAAGQRDILMGLLKKGANVNQKDKYGIQPLYYACLHGHYALASILVANKALVNHVNSKGHALYVASSKGFSAIVEMLLDNNGDPNLPGGPFGSALVAACHGGNVETVRLLLSHNVAIESTTKSRFSALHEAILSGRRSIVDLLLNNEVNVNESVEEKAALLVATETQKEDIVKVLIDKGASINVYHPTLGTALHIAIRKSREVRGETKLAELLLQKGANIHGTENWGPALHAAVEVGGTKILQLLLQYHADVNEVAKNGATALSIAGKEGLKEIGQLLIENGANLDAQGTAALEWAAPRAHVEMVRWLLERGVDVKVGHAIQFAATHIVVGSVQDTENKQKETTVKTIELLLDLGSRHGGEALEFARAVDNTSIVELLEARGFKEESEQLEYKHESDGEGERGTFE